MLARAKASHDTAVTSSTTAPPSPPPPLTAMDQRSTASGSYQELAPEEHAEWLRRVLGSDELHRLHARHAPAAAYEAVLKAIAQRVVEDSVLVVCGRVYSFVEVEAYYHGWVLHPRVVGCSLHGTGVWGLTTAACVWL